MKRISLILLAVLSGLVYSCSSNNSGETKGPLTDSVSIVKLDTQVVFSLSMVSNLPASLCWDTTGIDSVAAADSIITSITPLMDATLKNAATNGVPKLANWTRVWGPGVIAGHGDLANIPWVSLSSMTIFKDNSNNYVVGIEATNPNCPYDWDSLDFNVFKTEPWNYDSKANLSRGSWLGLNKYLLNLMDINQGTTAVQFLNNVIKTNANSSHTNIIVTGHSLGGALSPVFALYMQHQVDSIDTSSKVFCMSTAGPTPGNALFAADYNKTPLANRTIRLWNYFDVVPRAWVPSLLYPIANDIKKNATYHGLYAASHNSILFDSAYSCNNSLYPPMQPFAFTGEKTPGPITDLVGTIATDMLTYTYTHINGGTCFVGVGPDSSYLDGVPDTSSVLAQAFSVALPGCDTFMGQVGNQHVGAYTLYFNIKPLHEFMRAGVQQNPHSAVNWQCNNPQAATRAKRPMPTNPRSLFMSAIYKYAWRQF